jgi:hypothetical protein
METKEVHVYVCKVTPDGQAEIVVNNPYGPYYVHQDLLPLITGVQLQNPMNYIGVRAVRKLDCPDWEHTQAP